MNARPVISNGIIYNEKPLMM